MDVGLLQNMRSSIDRGAGLATLLACHCAGMVDLIALPVWMEVLITEYRLGPQRAGAVVSIFLIAAVATSIVLASRFNRAESWRWAAWGYALAALTFSASAATQNFAALCAFSLIGGGAIGVGLSFTHGAMSRGTNPHRVFAWAGASAGFFALAFYPVVALLAAHYGGSSLFLLIATVMAAAAIGAFVAFPARVPSAAAGLHGMRRFSGAVWLVILGVACMAMNQALVSSFLQNIGLGRGFGAERVNAMLLALAIVAMTPGPLAALLQRRIPASVVVLAGPVLQTAIAFVVTHSLAYAPFAVSGALMTSVQIFVHTFAFGLLARIEPSGRAAAATPAMIMSGSALGPFVAGSLVASNGYESIAFAVATFGALALICFHTATRARSDSASSRTEEVVG